MLVFSKRTLSGNQAQTLERRKGERFLYSRGGVNAGELRGEGEYPVW